MFAVLAVEGRDEGERGEPEGRGIDAEKVKVAYVGSLFGFSRLQPKKSLYA